MLRITIPPIEMWDDGKQEFVYRDEKTLQLEHSLVSLSKWESKWCKPFLTNKEKSTEESIDYIRCMTLTQNVNPDVYYRLTSENIAEVNRYIDAKMTATTFSDQGGGKMNHQQLTAEIIYHWMIEMQIPFECQKWHLNRLLTLIQVRSIMSQPPKKRSRREIMQRNTSLNAARKKQLKTRG